MSMISRLSYIKKRVYFLGLIIFMTLTLITGNRSHGYIMPAEQLVKFMAANFSKIRTLIITQSTRQTGQEDEDTEKAFKEQIWMRSPDLFHSKVIDQNGERGDLPDTIYRQLLIANNKERLENLLSRMGVNLQSYLHLR